MWEDVAEYGIVDRPEYGAGFVDAEGAGFDECSDGRPAAAWVSAVAASVATELMVVASRAASPCIALVDSFKDNKAVV
jgi:hypothetical protein